MENILDALRETANENTYVALVTAGVDEDGADYWDLYDAEFEKQMKALVEGIKKEFNIL